MKNIFKTGLFAFAAMFLYSCQDSLEVVMPELEIHFAEDGDEGYVDSYTIDADGALHCGVGDIVTIMISGDMDILYRYSGQFGQQYFTEDDVICNWGGDCKLQIYTYSATAYSTYREYTNIFTGEVDSTAVYQDNLVETMTTEHKGYVDPKNISMWVSKDFSGVKDSLNVVAATWVQVHDSLIGWPTKRDAVAGNWIDIENIEDPANPGVPFIDINSDSFYVGFLYDSDPCVRTPTAYSLNTDTGLYDTTYSYSYWGSTWQLRNFDMRRTYEDGRYQSYGLYSTVNANNYTASVIYAGFTMGVSMKDPRCVDSVDNVWACTAGYTTMTPTKNEDYSLVWDYDWAISKEFDMTLIPADDLATALKTTTADVPMSTNLSYSEAGTYTFTMVAANVTVEDRKELVRQLTIIVE